MQGKKRKDASKKGRIYTKEKGRIDTRKKGRIDTKEKGRIDTRKKGRINTRKKGSIVTSEKKRNNISGKELFFRTIATFKSQWERMDTKEKGKYYRVL